MKRGIITVTVLLLCLPGMGFAQDRMEDGQGRDRQDRQENRDKNAVTATDRHYLNDDEVKRLIIESEISAFQGECACPYSQRKTEGGVGEASLCGDNSEYYKADQDQKIHCYPDDLTESDVYNYRMLRNIPDKNQPWMMFPKYKK